ISQDSSLQNKLDTLIAAAALRKRTDVLSVRLNYRVYANAIPNDPNYNLQWHYPAINLPQAWDITTGSSNVIVAVVDSGVLLDHPDLSQPGKLVPGYDFIVNDTNSNDGQPGIDPDPYDVGNGGGGTVSSSFHGTHVAGTIAASSNNGIGVAGVAWGVKIMPIRVIGINGGSSYDVEQGIRFAAGLANDSRTVPAQKADIINLSLGGPANTTIAPPAYAQARAANVIVIAAAGNSATSTPSAPAAYTGVVSVSATNLSKQLASYSNFGNTIDVAAPGGSSGDLNGDGFPDRVFSTGGNDTSGTIQFNYNLKMGTSMAAPHVAGVAALMKSIYPAMTPSDFDNMLVRGDLTQDLGLVGRDNSFGYGLIDASKAVLAAQAASGVIIPPVQPPILTVTPTVLNYGVGLVGSDIVVQNIGGGSLSITSLTNDSGGWLGISPKLVDASGLGTYTLTVNRIGLVDGAYNSIVTVSSSAGIVTVAVSILSSSHNLLSDAGTQTIELLDANTLSRIDILSVPPLNGIYNYTFPNVSIGQYTIRSSSDLDNDSLLCELGESCGAYPILNGVGANIINVDGSIQNIINLDFETGFRTTLPAQ
ncbi:MAG: S8 family serine peptidase, partial [Thiohalomonadales bacterium]